MMVSREYPYVTCCAAAFAMATTYVFTSGIFRDTSLLSQAELTCLNSNIFVCLHKV